MNGKHLSNAMFRKLGTLVPQDDVLLPGLTVRQTLTFGAALTCKGLNKKARADRVQGYSCNHICSILFTVSYYHSF